MECIIFLCLFWVKKEKFLYLGVFVFVIGFFGITGIRIKVFEDVFRVD